MDVFEAIYTRRAVRAYRAQPVDRATLRRLIGAAIQAPSAVNAQPWRFTVVEDRVLLGRISRESKERMLGDPPRGLSADHFRAHLVDPAFDIFYAAPALVVVSSVTDDHWAVVNCALAAQNLMLAACAEGLGSCWIGFAEGWLRTEEGRRALSLPAGCVPIAPIIVGWPATTPEAVPRKEPVVSWIPAR